MFADQFAAPVRQVLDQTEIWVSAKDLPAVMTRLHDDEQFEVSNLIRAEYSNRFVAL